MREKAQVDYAWNPIKLNIPSGTNLHDEVKVT